MKPVLLATDGSPTAARATETAIDLARLLQSELAIVSVWNIGYPTTGGFAPIPMNGELAKLGEKEARRVASEAAARAEEAGVETLRSSRLASSCWAPTAGAR